MAQNAIALISYKSQLSALSRQARADMIDRIDTELREQFCTSYPQPLPPGAAMINIQSSQSMQDFVCFLENQQNLSCNDFQRFAQPAGPRQGSAAPMFPVSLFSFRQRSATVAQMWAAYDEILAQIDAQNADYVAADQINAGTIVKFLSQQANKMFNHSKRESARLCAFLSERGLDFSLSEDSVLGLRNLCYGCFHGVKGLLLEFLAQFPLKECKLCVDDVVDFGMRLFGEELNCIVLLRLVIFMLNLQGVCQRIAGNRGRE